MSTLYANPDSTPVSQCQRQGHLIRLADFAEHTPRGSLQGLQSASFVLHPSSGLYARTLGYLSRIEQDHWYRYGVALSAGDGWVPVLANGKTGKGTTLTQALEQSALFATPTLALLGAGILNEGYLTIREVHDG